MDIEVRAAAVSSGPVCGRARKRRGRPSAVDNDVDLDHGGGPAGYCSVERRLLAHGHAARQSVARGCCHEPSPQDRASTARDRPHDSRQFSRRAKAASAGVVRGAARRPVRVFRAVGGGAAGHGAVRRPPGRTLRAHAVDTRRAGRRARRGRHHEPDCGPRVREGRHPHLHRARRVRSRVPQADPRRRGRSALLGLGRVAHRPSGQSERAHGAHEHAHGRHQPNGGSAAAAT